MFNYPEPRFGLTIPNRTVIVQAVFGEKGNAMTFVLYHPRTRPSGRAVAEQLGCRVGGQMRRPTDALIRWGSQRLTVAAEPLIVLNSVSALVCAADKLRAFEAMAGADIPVPGFGTVCDGTIAQPLIGRTRCGRGGEGIVLYQPGETPDSHELYVDFIESVREYRLHVVGDEVIRAQYKVLEGDTASHIRNHKNGYRFKGVQGRRLHTRRIDAAVGAVQALGLDFGAVDMLIDENDDNYVLEVNTAPACSPLTAKAYADALGQMIDNQGRGQ